MSNESPDLSTLDHEALARMVGELEEQNDALRIVLEERQAQLATARAEASRAQAHSKSVEGLLLNAQRWLDVFKTYWMELTGATGVFTTSHLTHDLHLAALRWIQHARVEVDRLTKRVNQWQRRTNLFHEAYKKKDFESFALGLQKMQLEASGADVILPRQNRSLRARLLDVCKERNRLRAALAQAGERIKKEVASVARSTATQYREIAEHNLARESWLDRANELDDFAGVVSTLDLAAIVTASAGTANVVLSNQTRPCCSECNEEKNLAYIQTNAEAEEWLCKTCRHHFQFKPTAEGREGNK